MNVKIWNEQDAGEKLKTPILKLEKSRIVNDGTVELNVVDEDGEVIGSLFQIIDGEIHRCHRCKDVLEQEGYDTSCFRWNAAGQIMDTNDTRFNKLI